MKTNSKILLVSGSLLGLLTFALLWCIEYINELKEENTILYESINLSDVKIDSQKNIIISEQNLIKELTKENEEQAKQILALRKKKQKVVYRTQTKYETKTVEKIVKVLPDNYTFYTDYDLPICKYEKQQQDYIFKTLPVEYSATVTLTEKENIVSIEAKSLYDNKTYSVPIKQTETLKVKEKKDNIFEPKVHLGIAATSDLKASGTLGVSFLQYKDFNFAKLNLILNDKASIGISPVTYNLSNHIALMNNTSIEAGISTDLNQNYFYLGFTTEL